MAPLAAPVVVEAVVDVVVGVVEFGAPVLAVLGLPEPVYHHHKLVLDAAGQKLAKSSAATSLRELRAGGATPMDIRRMVGLAR